MPQTVAVAAEPGLQQTELRHRLAGVRRRLRFVTTFRGTTWLLALLFGGAAAAGLLDYRFHLPDVVRAVLLVGLLGGTGYVFYRRLFLPMRVKDDDLTLALRIEQLYPGLNDNFASAVQFLDTEDGNNSPALRREAIRRGLRGVSKCDFSRLVNTRGLWRLGLVALVPVLVAVGLGAWQPASAGVALLRLADPFGDHAWPTKTRIELDDFRHSIGHNEPFEVGVRLSGVIPPTATVAFRLDSGAPTEYICDVVEAGDGTVGSFRGRLEAGKAKGKTFAFQVRANDAVSKWEPIQVLPPPQLVPLDGKASPQVQVSYPPYTRLPATDIEPGSGKVVAVNGSVVTLRAATDRPLSAAWIEFRPEPQTVAMELLLAPLGVGDPFAAPAVAAAHRGVTEPVAAELVGDRRELRVTFTPPVSGNYVLHFVDETNLHNSRMFELNVFPDPAPTVTLERPSPARDNLIVLPNAVLELQVMAEDQQFAVRHVWLEYRCKQTDPPRRVRLFAPGPDVQERPQRVPVARKLALKEFKHLDPAEGGLKEGDVLTLQACADDYDDVSAGKEPGRSVEVEIRIVSQNALELVVNQAQAKVQQELVILRKLQQEATRKVNDVQQHLKQQGKLSQEDLEQLVDASQTQEQIQKRIGDKQEGLRAEVERIRETLRDNPLPRSGGEKRMDRVAEELDRLQRDELPQIEPRLTNARKQDDGAHNPDKAAARERAERKEREAKEAQRQADEKQKAADEAERLVKDRPKDDPERLKAEQDAAAKKKDAQAERDRARDLQKEAKELRQQSDGARQFLQEARKHQEEVEKTLDDLLNNHLDSFASTQEVKGEAKSLLEEEKRLQRETEELQKKELAGMKPEERKDFEAAMERLQQEQQKLRERTEQLLDRMDRVAEARAERDPQTAKEMKDAADLGRKENIPESMREAQEKLKDHRPSDAAKKEQESVEKLQNLVKQLEDRRSAELSRAAQNLRKEEQELQKLQEDMEKLRKKMQEAEKIPDEKEREKELQRLAREQEKLEEKLRQQAERLTRQTPRAAQAAQKAAQAAQRAAEKLRRGEDAEEEEKEVLDRLQEAREELKKARDQIEDELEREELAKVADQLKGIKERQEALNAERERIQKELLLRRPENWRGLRISLNDLSRNQGAESGLAKELTGLADKKLEGAPVFARVLKKAAEVMEQASQQLRKHSADLKEEPTTEAGTEAARLQKDALARLETVLQALKEEQNAPLARRDDDGGGGGGGGGEDGGGGGAGNGSEIPPLAQLKMLRQLQADINKRTEDFRKAHPDPMKLDDKGRAELQTIRKAQQEVAELLEELIEPGEAGGDKP
jgi:hypothetical protein